MLSSWIQHLLHPALSQLGFLDTGRGIERRFKRFGIHWKEHLDNALQEQQHWITARERSGFLRGRCAVLGAGRLYDWNAAAHLRAFEEITFVDADPGVRAKWNGVKHNSAGTKITEIIGDVTTVLKPWHDALESRLKAVSISKKRMKNDLQKQWSAALDAVRLAPFRANEGLVSELPPSLFLNHGPYDAILSLNLLSQIPIVWQEIIDRSLAKYFPRQWLREHEEEWLEIYTFSARSLVEQHLRDLAASSAQSILVITDLDYAYYFGSLTFESKKVASYPLKWSEVSKAWEVPSAASMSGAISRVEASPALYGVSLTSPDDRRRLLPGYELTRNTSWLWHIAPLGLDPTLRNAQREAKGALHRVGAFHFERVSPPVSSRAPRNTPHCSG